MKFVLGETIDKEHLRSCALGGISIASELLAAWDTCDIATEQAKRLIKEGDITDEDTAFQIACEDQDLYTMEWEYLIEYLTELMAGRNPGGAWECNAKNFGWRSLDGYKYFAAETGADFLSAILPKTDCTFKIFDFQNGEGFAVQNWHHDSPMGREWYYVMPDKREQCPTCGDTDEKGYHKECPECKAYYCEYCFGDGDICDECLPSDYVCYEEAVSEYKEIYLPAIRKQEYEFGYADLPARREAWNNYTDALHKDNRITLWQYENWDHPSCTEGD